jgi:hypothetical protein
MSCVISDLTNQRFGRLTVLSKAGRDKWGQVLWNCKCDCNGYVVVTGGNLRNRKEKNSCGCVKAERFRKTYRKHGHTRQWLDNGKVRVSPEYRSWQGMKKRCLDKNHVYYKNYGGRGIKICDRWVTSFENFLSDMGSRPPKTTLDRINPNGDYEPSNCQWATWQVQARNKRPT